VVGQKIQTLVAVNVKLLAREKKFGECKPETIVECPDFSETLDLVSNIHAKSVR
jgi:hypothetical protein